MLFPVLLNKIHYNMYFCNPVVDSLCRDIDLRSFACAFARRLLSVKDVVRIVPRSAIFIRSSDIFLSAFVPGSASGSTFPSRAYIVYIRTAPGNCRWRVRSCASLRDVEDGGFGDSNLEQRTLSLLRNRTKRCLARRRVLNITEGSFYDPLNISY